MPRALSRRLTALLLGLFVMAAYPASVLAHGIAHERGEHHRQHRISLEAHDGPAEVSVPGHGRTHLHPTLDHSSRTTQDHLILGPVVVHVARAPDLAPAIRTAQASERTLPARASPHHDPPRLRAPPLL
jgi:hypothetical protein